MSLSSAAAAREDVSVTVPREALDDCDSTGGIAEFFLTYSNESGTIDLSYQEAYS